MGEPTAPPGPSATPDVEALTQQLELFRDLTTVERTEELTYDETAASFINQFRDISVHSGMMMVDMNKQLMHLETRVEALEKSKTYSIYGDWMKSFHGLVADDLGCYPTNFLLRSLRKEERNAKENQYDKWSKGLHERLRLYLKGNGISVVEWDVSYTFRKSHNSSFKVRDLSNMDDWEAQLHDDIAQLDSIVTDQTDNKMLRKILTAFKDMYLHLN